MPRRFQHRSSPKPRRSNLLVDVLADELKSSAEFGQPLIEEEEFKSGAIRVVVLWDQWDQAPQEERSRVIIEAYRITFGDEYADRIGMVTGLTIPEARASGMLPYQVIVALRKGDPVTIDRCREAMIAEGASTLDDPNRPQLRFASEEEADASLRRLSARLPGSEQVWQVLQEVGQSLDLAWRDSD